MNRHPYRPLPSMRGEALYRIRVRGSLGSDWARRLESMEITLETRPDGEVESVLSGRLADQAALSGVLNTLYELHLPVLSVECLEA